jgi:tripartite-type tricarboxylate transporter receptor subunit TctC
MTAKNALLAACAVAITCAAAPAAAQDYPNKPIHLIVPYAAGGGADVVARIIAKRLSEQLKQPIVVENRAGASGNIGALAVAKAAPDGYTLLAANNTIVANPLIGKVPFDVLKDFKPVGIMGSSPSVIAVHPSVPATNLQQLVDLLSANPDKYSYASCGNGTTMHFSGEMIKHVLKVSMVHVGYKGCGPAVVDLMAGHVPIAINTYLNLKGPAEQGRVRLLAIASVKRSSLAPQLPTTGEAVPALRGVIADNWLGILAPAGVPNNIIERLNAEINLAVDSPETRAGLEQAALDIRSSTASAFGDVMREEMERWSKLMKDTGMVIEQ